MRKKTFLLLEILIAFSLMGTLISILFSFLIQTTKVEKKMESVRSAILERQMIQVQLQDLFTSLCSDNPLYTKQFPDEDKESLIIQFDHGIDPDPQFSGKLVGRIHVDQNHDLCFTYWPLESTKSRSWRKEILFSHVKDVSFSFLKTNEKVEENEPSKITWLNQWPKNMKSVPSIVRLNLSLDQSTLQFAFYLPSATPVVTYRSRM